MGQVGPLPKDYTASPSKAETAVHYSAIVPPLLSFFFPFDFSVFLFPLRFPVDLSEEDPDFARTANFDLHCTAKDGSRFFFPAAKLTNPHLYLSSPPRR